MKILFINTVDTEGGAALAAYQLNGELKKRYDTENYFIVGRKISQNNNVFSTRDHHREIIKQIKIFIEFFINKIFNKLGLQYRCFPFSSRFILTKIKELKPDIISLHNIHGGYFRTPLLAKISKLSPVVWTLHDMWPFTANAAHTFEDDAWKYLKKGENEKNIYPNIGINTGNWLIKQKKKIYQKSEMYLVAPSVFFCQLAKEAPVFRGKEIFHISHGIDLEIFKKKDKKSCRQALEIAQDAGVLMFSSASDLMKNLWKGGVLLLEILEAINSEVDKPVEVIILGKGQLRVGNNFANLRIRHLGFIQNPQLISVLLSASDLLIYPSRADSLGLVLIEAIACGVPAVTFDIGGCGDVIKNDISGYVIKPFEVTEFVARTIELLNNKDKLEKLSLSARHWAEKNFDLKDMARQYYGLFEKIISFKRK